MASDGQRSQSDGLVVVWHPDAITYNQFMPPDYYFLMTRLFALPDDVQQRSVIVHSTRPNPPLLALFGVRYLIMDEKMPDVPNVSLKKFFQWRWPCGAGTQCNAAEYLRKQLLYELDHPNLGDYSPTIQIVEPTASGALARMVDPSFDPRRSVVLHASIPENLVVAERSAMFWEKAGLRINANQREPLYWYCHCNLPNVWMLFPKRTI